MVTGPVQTECFLTFLLIQFWTKLYRLIDRSLFRGLTVTFNADGLVTRHETRTPGEDQILWGGCITQWSTWTSFDQQCMDHTFNKLLLIREPTIFTYISKSLHVSPRPVKPLTFSISLMMNAPSLIVKVESRPNIHILHKFSWPSEVVIFTVRCFLR